MNDETVEQPEEGRLFERVQKDLKKVGVSQRQLAERAGISEGRWRQIVKGYQSAGGGQIPVRAPADTLARMALAAGIADFGLEAVGRPDAAASMRELERVANEAAADRSQVSLAPVHLLQKAIDQTLEMETRIRELEAQVARLEASGHIPSDLAARQVGRVGGTSQARSAQDHEGESPDEER